MPVNKNLKYIVLFVFSLLVICVSVFLPLGDELSVIIQGIGAGGVSSVFVAWMIDWRTYLEKKAEDKNKCENILRQYVLLFQRLCWTAANECYGLYQDNTPRSLKQWLNILCDADNYKDQNQMQKRCVRVSSNVIEIQKFAEQFISQSATLIMSDYPNINKLLDFFKVHSVHCWGTLAQLEHDNCKAFCDTIYILYEEFQKQFPQYIDQFPEEYTTKNITTS